MEASKDTTPDEQQRPEHAEHHTHEHHAEASETSPGKEESKQKHEERHEHEHHAHHHAPKRKTVDGWRYATIALAIILIIIGIQMVLPKNNGQSNTANGGQGAANAAPGSMYQKYQDVIAGAPTLGSKNASIIMVEFSDYQCPYCGQFETSTFPQLKKDYIDTGKVLFAYRNMPLPIHSNSMIAAEAAECANAQGKFWEYHDKLFANQDALDAASLKQYAADLGLDTAAFDKCLDNKTYDSVIQADIAAAQQYGISGTPSFVINGQTVVGALPLSSFEAQFQSINNPVPFNAYVLSDKRCTACASQATQIEQVTKQLFPSAQIVDLDVSDPQGQQFIKDYNITLAPALILDEKAKQSAGWSTNTQIQPLFHDTGKYLILDPTATGSTWIIDDQQRAAAQTQMNQQLGLQAGKPQVDFFIMSFCPYGNEAEQTLKPVYDQLKGEANFKPRYIIYNSGTGCMNDTDGTQYCSLHGGQELHQDIREMCTYNMYGIDKWFSFALAMDDNCTAQNADSCWTGVAKSLGLDTAKISDCEKTQGMSLIKQEYQLDQVTGAQASPTLFFDGQEYSGARTANDYMAALCAGFPSGAMPAACDNITVTTPTAATTPTGSCG